jgi:pSer/pThr/pTyr-binding forkhead associated (FHA) protein
MMQVSITTLNRRRNGSIGRKEDVKACEVLRIGRGAENEIFLSDFRVPLHLAELHEGADGLFIEANGTNDLRLNGSIIRKAHVNAGDVVGIGPYELIVTEPEDGINIAVTIELVHPIGDDVESLLSRSTLTTNNIGLTKRASSWILASLTLILFLALPLFMADTPLTKYFGAPVSDKTANSMTNQNDVDFDVSWVSGEVMNSHKFFANDCAACHTKAFVMVEDAACTACHTKQHGHIDKVKFPAEELTSTRCATCHTDHQGPHPIRAAKQELCSDCHNDLDRKVEGMHLANVSDFETNHPQFKPTIWQNPSKGIQKRISLDENPVEVSNLKFPHKTHMNVNRMRNPTTGKNTQLECASCHVPEISGAYIEPVKMEEHCGDCHLLTFDSIAPKRMVSHGKPEEIYQELTEFYSSLALKGGASDKTAPKVVRRRPGTPFVNGEEKKEALQWADLKTKKAARYLFSASQCGSCHEVIKDQKNASGYSVEPVKVTQIWQPKSVFDHGKHKDVACAECHAADTSMKSSDVLLPKIEGCQTCHGGEQATDKIPSTCISCHGFHRDDVAIMTGSTGKTVQ